MNEEWLKGEMPSFDVAFFVQWNSWANRSRIASFYIKKDKKPTILSAFIQRDINCLLELCSVWVSFPLSSILWQHIHFTLKKRPHVPTLKNLRTSSSVNEASDGIQLISFLPQIEGTKKWETWIRACVSQLARLWLIPYQREAVCRYKCCSAKNPDGFVQCILRFELHYLRGTWS